MASPTPSRPAPGQLAIIQEALVNAETHCRYHQQRWDFLGREWPGGPPRCDSCKQPWRISRALDALDALVRASLPAAAALPEGDETNA